MDREEAIRKKLADTAKELKKNPPSADAVCGNDESEKRKKLKELLEEAPRKVSDDRPSCGNGRTPVAPPKKDPDTPLDPRVPTDKIKGIKK